jgi:hypothetical protein
MILCYAEILLLSISSVTYLAGLYKKPTAKLWRVHYPNIDHVTVYVFLLATLVVGL